MRVDLKHIVVAVVTALAMTACSDSSCYDNGSALPLVRFYGSGTTTQCSLKNLSVRGVDAPGDSVLVNNETVQEVYLPLRVGVSSTQWVFDYNTEGVISDTLSLTYEAIPYFSSVECGAMYNFKLNKVTVTHHVIDSVAVVKPVIDNVADVAIRLFFPVE